MSAKVNVTPLNLTYEALKLYVEGKMDIAFQAARMKFDLSKKFKLEVVQPPTADNDVEPLEDNGASRRLETACKVNEVSAPALNRLSVSSAQPAFWG